MFNTGWDVDRYRIEHESDEHWGLRRQFMVAHKDKYPEDRLVCLTQVFFNMEFLGCKYPHKTMELVNRLAKEVAEEFRESRKGRLKRTFVGAQDAAGAKAKGSKPPPGALEGLSSSQPKQEVHGESVPKKPKLEEVEPESQSEATGSDKDRPKPVPDTRDVSADAREVGKTFILMIPPRTNSMTEQDTNNIIYSNFPGNQLSLKFNGSKQEGGWTCEVWVNPVAGTQQKPSLCVASCFSPTQREGKVQATTNAVATLKKFCTYIEPNPTWFKGGGTPEFIEKRIPCDKQPRTYLIMTKNDTGHITPQVAETLLANFQQSSNEDMFFIDTEYNEKEKVQLLQCSQKFKLGFRHFGSKKQMKDRHICVSKTKSPEEVVEEARMFGGKHPKYLVNLRTP